MAQLQSNAPESFVNHSFSSSKDFHDAIDALETSTRALENHVGTVEEILASVRRTGSHERNTRPRSVVERQQQSKLLDTLRNDIQYRQHDSAARTHQALSTTLVAIDDTLSRQDHLLAQIDGQIKDPEHSPFEEGRRVEKLLRALEKIHVDTVQLRLDRNLLENLPRDIDEAYDEGRGGPVDSETRLVQDDLKILYNEISSVVKMLVNQQHGDNIRAVTSEVNSALITLQSQQTRDAIAQISEMTAQLETLSTHAETLQSHRSMMQKLNTHVKDFESRQSTLSAPLSSPPSLVGSGRPSVSLNALRQYLAVDTDPVTDSSGPEQISAVFRQLISQMSTLMSIQAEQRTHLNGTACTDSHTPAHKSSLSGLDKMIAEIKAQMDALPN